MRSISESAAAEVKCVDAKAAKAISLASAPGRSPTIGGRSRPLAGAPGRSPTIGGRSRPLAGAPGRSPTESASSSYSSAFKGSNACSLPRHSPASFLASSPPAPPQPRHLPPEASPAPQRVDGADWPSPPHTSAIDNQWTATVGARREDSRPLDSYQRLTEEGSVDDGESGTAAAAAPPAAASGQLIDEESAHVGSVRWTVYLDYIRSLGFLISAFVVILYIVAQAMKTANNVWLARWTNEISANANNTRPNGEAASNNTRPNGDAALYLGVYAAIGLSEGVVDFLRELGLFLACAKASKSIHARLLTRVVKSPTSFFDTNPVGRIINRFSADVDVIDQTLPYQVSDFLYCFCESIAVVLIISVTTPFFLVVMLPVLAAYFFIQKYYIATSRQVKRLESISKSPIFAHFSESLSGLAVIRAFNQGPRFVAESEARVGDNVRCNYLILTLNRWLGMRIESLGNCVILAAAALAVVDRDSLLPGTAALSITYSLEIVDMLNWMVRMVCELETNCVALERVFDYADNNPQEAAWSVPRVDGALPARWPEDGRVRFTGYETRYRPGLEPVLRGLTLELDAREKVGLCGRTGAGKSSLTLALFRIIEPTSGSIEIDDVDISEIGLHHLRSRLTIIPQDPVLFSGSVRFNLDPTEAHDDDQLWTALEQAHLKSHVSALSGGLRHDVSEGGSNFSMGQRQLICLARALLRKSKVLVMDEATAAVDMETDELIQATIRSAFADCTVLTIAHRLKTIMDGDRVVVLSQGAIVEADSPQRLLERDDSSFAEMARNAGIGGGGNGLK